jgi:ubiquitin-conjugating enzyme E2 D/E
MASLARIRREYMDVQKECTDTVSAGPKNDSNLYEWEGYILGPIGSPYEGGLFRLEISFPQDYPFKPPFVRFVTPVYHPNINKSGGICVDILKPQNWSPVLTISKVLLSISSLLTDANPNDPLEPDVAQQYILNRLLFDTTARKWTVRYAQP